MNVIGFYVSNKWLKLVFMKKPRVFITYTTLHIVIAIIRYLQNHHFMFMCFFKNNCKLLVFHLYSPLPLSRPPTLSSALSFKKMQRRLAVSTTITVPYLSPPHRHLHLPSTSITATFRDWHQPMRSQRWSEHRKGHKTY